MEGKTIIKDTFVLILFAIVFFVVCLLFFKLFVADKTVAQKPSEATVLIPPQTGVTTDDEGKLIPINEAVLPDGQYQGQLKIPILTYHYIRPLPGDDDRLGQNLSVSPEQFEKQIKYLSDNGYKAMTFDDLRANNIPDKPVILTFDDGYRDAYSDAFPVLKKYNFNAVFYIITGFVGQERYLTWAMMKEMSRAGMVFGSHSVSHPDLGKEDIEDEKVEYELSESKEILTEQLGKEIKDFCYPSGQANTKTVTAVYKAGYKTAVSTQIDFAKKGDYLLWLPRLRIKNDTNMLKIMN